MKELDFISAIVFLQQIFKHMDNSQSAVNEVLNSQTKVATNFCLILLLFVTFHSFQVDTIAPTYSRATFIQLAVPPFIIQFRHYHVII